MGEIEEEGFDQRNKVEFFLFEYSDPVESGEEVVLSTLSKDAAMPRHWMMKLVRFSAGPSTRRMYKPAGLGLDHD